MPIATRSSSRECRSAGRASPRRSRGWRRFLRQSVPATPRAPSSRSTADPRTVREEIPVKAVLCKQFGPPESLVIEEVPSPQAGPGEVVVSVKAASVNFPDVLIIQNKSQFKPPLPFSPGSELAGVVKEVGEG